MERFVNSLLSTALIVAIVFAAVMVAAIVERSWPW